MYLYYLCIKNILIIQNIIMKLIINIVNLTIFHNVYLLQIYYEKNYLKICDIAGKIVRKSCYTSKNGKDSFVSNFLCIFLRNEFSHSLVVSNLNFDSTQFDSSRNGIRGKTRILYILFLQKISLFYLQLKLQKLFYNHYCNISQNILKEGKKFQKNSLFVFYNFLLIFFITFLFFLFFAIHFIKLIEKFRCRFIKILL